MKNVLEKLNNGHLFKLVLGLGNLNMEQIKNLVNIYSKTQTDIIDLPPNQEVVDLVFRELAKRNIKIDKFVYCLSFGLKEDKPNSCAYVDKKKCIGCEKCIEMCSQNAIFKKEKYCNQKLVNV